MHNVFDELFVWGALIKIFVAFCMQATNIYVKNGFWKPTTLSDYP